MNTVRRYVTRGIIALTVGAACHAVERQPLAERLDCLDLNGQCVARCARYAAERWRRGPPDGEDAGRGVLARRASVVLGPPELRLPGPAAV